MLMSSHTAPQTAPQGQRIAQEVCPRQQEGLRAVPKRKPGPSLHPIGLSLTRRPQFTDQRDKLTERREELEKSAESINELIEVLDQRKDEAIERTFKQVSKNFEEVFDKLVPLGRGRLIMQKRLDRVSLARSFRARRAWCLPRHAARG